MFFCLFFFVFLVFFFFTCLVSFLFLFFLLFQGEFLGPAYWRNGPEVQPAGQTELEYEKSLLVNKENDLFHCVIYLAPGIFQLKFYLVI